MYYLFHSLFFLFLGIIPEAKGINHWTMWGENDVFFWKVNSGVSTV